ncbi:MAG: DUF192 domain-containing protein [Microthrixaceae bacterium]
MAWLVRDGEVLASVEVATGAGARARGLLGRDGLDGAMWLPGVKSVHSFGMRFDLDVAFVDADGLVFKTVLLRRNRISAPHPRAGGVLEAQAGAFREWTLHVGDVVEIR